MNYQFLAAGDLDALAHAIDHLCDRGAKSLQVLGAVGNPGSADEINAVLTQSPVPIFGGLFPGLIHNQQTTPQGWLVIGHREAPQVVVLPCEPTTDDAERLQQLAHSSTNFVYFDATHSIGSLVELLYDELGSQPAWIGGGAGALDFKPRPVVITPDGLTEGVAVVAGMQAISHVGVTHGWEAIGEELKITDASGNDVCGLNWRPAFEVYREVVEDHSGRRFDEEDFFAIASTYPVLLDRLGSEGIVRDPLAPLDAKGLRFAGNMPQHATVQIANGSIEGMLTAAEAARDAVAPVATPDAWGSLTIDCISRALVLGDELPRELEALSLPHHPQLGALTLGEIANSQGRYLQLHNKTTVIAVIE